MSLSEKKLSNDEMQEVSGGAGGEAHYKITIIEGGVNAHIFENGTLSNETVFIPGGTIIELPGNTIAFGQISVPYGGHIVMLAGSDYIPVVYKS